MLFSLYALTLPLQAKKVLYMIHTEKSWPLYMIQPETSETSREKASPRTGLLSSLFSVVLPQRALTPSTATRRWNSPEELCLLSSFKTMPTASVAFFTRVMPCGKESDLEHFWRPPQALIPTHVGLFQYLFHHFSQRTAFLSALSLIPDILLLNFYLKARKQNKNYK